MAQENELNEEILDAGVAYTLYAAALVNLAITLNKGADQTEEYKAVSNYGNRLRGALIRCNIQKEIPLDLQTADEIMNLLQTSSLMMDIGNELAGKYSRRQDHIFILACLLGEVFSGSLGGVQNATHAARSQALSVAHLLQVPGYVVESCLKQQNLTPFCMYLRTTTWSEIIEAKPGLWGFNVDLKALIGHMKRWFSRR